MKNFKRYTIIGIIFVLITGTLAHFLYDWSDENQIVGLFTPINESIWEHMKLLFFPCIIYSPVLIFKFKKKEPSLTAALCVGIITGTLLIPLLYYSYSYILGKDIFILDISIFILSSVTAFWIMYKLTLFRKLKSFTFLLYFLICLIFICFLIFTYHAPNITVFQDPTVSDNS